MLDFDKGVSHADIMGELDRLAARILDHQQDVQYHRESLKVHQTRLDDYIDAFSDLLRFANMHGTEVKSIYNLGEYTFEVTPQCITQSWTPSKSGA